MIVLIDKKIKEIKKINFVRYYRVLCAYAAKIFFIVSEKKYSKKLDNVF